MDEEQDYLIVITSSAERAYFEVLGYVYEHHSETRAGKIALELLEFPKILQKFPNLGTKELHLQNRIENYKYIVYKRTPRATVKIIYFINEETKTIYLTDFFPCEMFEQKIKRGKESLNDE